MPNAPLAAFGNEVFDLAYCCCFHPCSGFSSSSCIGLNRRPLNSSDIKRGLLCSCASMCSLGAWLFWEGENEGSSCHLHERTDPTFNFVARWYLHGTLANYSLRQHMAQSVTRGWRDRVSDFGAQSGASLFTVLSFKVRVWRWESTLLHLLLLVLIKLLQCLNVT